MKLISATLPDGAKLALEDAMALNIGIGVIPEFKVQVTDQEWLVPEDQPFASIIHMTVLFDFSKGRYTASFVGLEAHHEITGTDLREVRVAEVLRLASSAGIFVKLDKDDPPASILDWWGTDPVSFVDSPVEKMAKEDGPVDWVLQQLSLVYNIAQVSSQHPAKAVEKAFGLPARTAARWIAKARDKGVLKRPSVPGWEDVVEGSDKIREVKIKGQRYVRKADVENVVSLIKAKDGEHPEAP